MAHVSVSVGSTLPLKPSRVYLEEYRRTLPSIEQQVDVLRAKWPRLNPDHIIRYARERNELFQPPWVESYFVLIRAGFFSNKPREEIEEVLNALDGPYHLHNYRRGQLGSKHLRRDPFSLQCEARIAQFQPGDLLLVGGQFGKHYAGESVSEVRDQANDRDHGWCFGTRDIGCMLLTHPNRLFPNEKVHCPGDQYSVHGDGNFNRAPCFDMGSHKLKFDTHPIANTYEEYDSPTGYSGRRVA